MSNNAHELSNRLLNALDNNYNVVDMQAVNEIISILEKFNITKELLETTRLGKHVNELRRKTTDPTLARRAKVLVKRWRDLVIPTVASPGHAGSNRSSAERQMRRLGGTPLTSPALSRQVVSPAVPSPRPPSRPAWGGYESDSQDVILVDDEPPPAPPPAPPSSLKPVTPPVKRPPSPEPLYDDRKAKRDKKLRRKRGHSRAGAGTETPAAGAGAGAGPGGGAWGARNGAAHGERRRNGWRRDAPDTYSALGARLPPAGAKKVKTTKELLEQIQQRCSRTGSSRPVSPRSPASPDVMFIEPDTCPVKVDSPLRNGGSEPPAPAPTIDAAAPSVFPLEDERDYGECLCDGDEEHAECPAARRLCVEPLHVQLLHHALLPGVNGTRAPPQPHPYAVRHAADLERPGFFAAVVPLYKYSDYADDACVKNLARVPLCSHLPWTQFAPPPPDPPPQPPTPPPRPYPLDDAPPPPPDPDSLDDDSSSLLEVKAEPPDEASSPPVENATEMPTVEAEMVGVPTLEPSERLKAPLLDAEDESQFGACEAIAEPLCTEKNFMHEPPEHRTVERTKEELNGRALLETCAGALRAAPWSYSHAAAAPTLALTEPAPDEQAVRSSLAPGEPPAERDELGRPPRAAHFAEWHECARLGELLALPYVVID